MNENVKHALRVLACQVMDDLDPPAVSHETTRDNGGAIKTNDLADLIFALPPGDRPMLSKWSLVNFQVALGALAKDKTTVQMGMVRWVGAAKSSEPWNQFQWISVDIVVGDDASDV